MSEEPIVVCCCLLFFLKVFDHRILRSLEDPSDSLALIRDHDCLVAYRLPKETESSRLVVFMHQKAERYTTHSSFLFDFVMSADKGPTGFLEEYPFQLFPVEICMTWLQARSNCINQSYY